MTQPKIEAQMRRQIAAFLPDAITTAMNSYNDFYGGAEIADAEDPKAFSAHHTACKAAIAHIDLLIKLAKWADLPEETGQNDDDVKLAKILGDAQKELDNLQF